MLTMEELVMTAIENQPLILEQELKKGVPLNYFDENGQYVLRYPDGHVEPAELHPLSFEKEGLCQN